jgi:hypothetical protein
LGDELQDVRSSSDPKGEVDEESQPDLRDRSLRDLDESGRFSAASGSLEDDSSTLGERRAQIFDA